MDSKSNKISGRVVLKESGAGIRDLLVVLHDIDPGTKPEEAIERDEGVDRIGSVLTKADGSFELSYEDAEFRTRNVEKRPDVVLRVLVPEEPGQSPEAGVLFVSRAVRQNAGRTEQYLVRIPAALLEKAGLPVPSVVATAPSDAEPARGRIQRLREDATRASEILTGSLDVSRARVDHHRTQFAGFRQALHGALSSALAATPTQVLQPDRFVKAGDSPAAKSATVMQQNLRAVVNSNDPAIRAPARGFISLTPAEVTTLRKEVDATGSVPEEAVVKLAVAGGSESATTFLQRSALLPICRPSTTESRACLDALDDTAPAPGPVPLSPGPNPPGPSAVTAADLTAFIGRLMNPLTAPEEALVTGLTPAATLASVQDSVRGLFFEPSPADVPAFHDFHHLQIAFQSVWQELTDQGVIDLAQDAYDAIVELGGDPTRPDYKGLHPLVAIKTEGRLALSALRSTQAPAGKPDDDEGGGLLGLLGIFADKKKNPAVVDPVVRLPALLSELESRLREKYSFAIFAANAQERSVNFGILNTFRQVWTPLAYQAGPLVKSIPLAPKQTQKLVVTRRTSKKRHRKEVENNLRVVRSETSETSRAEQEIAARASAKSDFSYENKAEGGMEGVGKDTSTTTFKHEAKKSSDDVKKAFRESVFKAAQEVKNERTTEITTDESEEFESVETTEISNPNDEIACTYLFYELQRRYRVHERLHRVRPVVLVAQEVPAPHEIDQAWLIAHDWILRRAILDDSFLPTLASLTTTAGAETAIEQLAANVSQQRRIVEQLRRELAIAQRSSDVQGVAVAGAVGEKTGGGGLFGDLVGAALGPVAGKVGDILFSGDAAENQANQGTLKSAAEQAADRIRDLIFRLEREVTALNAITETFAKALEAHHNLLTEIARLRVHIKENILYYMQAIWRSEPPDQRYFRLHNTPIPTLKKTERRFQIAFDLPSAAPAIQAHRALPRFGGRNATLFPVETIVTFPVPATLETEPLCEVADLDDLLGFKGNYMLFPLLESNPLTDYMMEPFVDRATGELVDPSDPAGWSLDEFSQYVCCLDHELADDEFEALRPALKAQYQALLTARRDDDVLVVPTNSLFIECLPASHSLIERFKKDHRMLDVKKVQGEVRHIELENLRRAARLLADEREDPDIEKKVIIEGNVTPHVPVDDPA